MEEVDKQGQLTLTIGTHVRHRSILHHPCRGSTSHHGGIRGSREVTALSAPHWELLRVIHHLLGLAWGRARLQVRILLRWGAVEGWTTSRIWVAIRGRVHGWMMPEPRAGREVPTRGEVSLSEAAAAGCDNTTTTSVADQIRSCGYRSGEGVRASIKSIEKASAEVGVDE